MTDGAHDRDTTRRHVAHELLVVEREEVVLRTATAPYDDDVDVRHALQNAKRLSNRLRCAVLLNLRWREEDVRLLHDGRRPCRCRG